MQILKTLIQLCRLWPESWLNAVPGALPEAWRTRGCVLLSSVPSTRSPGPSRADLGLWRSWKSIYNWNLYTNIHKLLSLVYCAAWHAFHISVYCADPAFRSFIKRACPGTFPLAMSRAALSAATQSSASCGRIPLEMRHWALNVVQSLLSRPFFQELQSMAKLSPTFASGKKKPCWARLIGMSKEFIGPFCCQNGKAKWMFALETRQEAPRGVSAKTAKPGSEKHVLLQKQIR